MSCFNLKIRDGIRNYNWLFSYLIYNGTLESWICTKIQKISIIFCLKLTIFNCGLSINWILHQRRKLSKLNTSTRGVYRDLLEVSQLRIFFPFFIAPPDALCNHPWLEHRQMTISHKWNCELEMPFLIGRSFKMTMGVPLIN